MNSGDPQPNPFGYTFHAGDHYGPETSAFANGGTSLLTEVEENFIGDFFQHTDPNADTFLFDAPQFSSHTDAKDGFDGLSWNYVPPATIHGVSTTIPDQAQLHSGFNFPQIYAPEPLSVGHLGNTEDDLQAASTLSNAQASYAHANANGRARSFHGLLPATTGPNTSFTPGMHTNMPMVSTPHGLLHEQIAALFPNHNDNESLDAHMAAQFASTQVQLSHEAQLAELERQRPVLKRSYTYGTDNSFNHNGFVGAPLNTSTEAAAQRLLVDLHRPQPSTRHSASDSKGVKPLLPGLIRIPSSDEGQSDGATSDDDDDDRPSKKRRKAKKSTATKNGRPGSARKSSSAMRGPKIRKVSLDEDMGRKKRLSSAGQKAQRENLSDEQKRSNHILSEQKRRNLIKRGFDDLHDLVPEIRNGGLSKSSVLTEAANFLDMLIEENDKFTALLEDADG